MAQEMDKLRHRSLWNEYGLLSVSPPAVVVAVIAEVSVLAAQEVVPDAPHSADMAAGLAVEVPAAMVDRMSVAHPASVSEQVARFANHARSLCSTPRYRRSFSHNMDNA